MSSPTSTRTNTGRHAVNVSHLVMGLAFLGLTVVAGLVAGDVVEGAEIRFLLPLPWVLAGVGGLAALALRERRRHAPENEATDQPPVN